VPSTRRHAAIVGVLYILATVTALLALPLYAPLLTGPEYLVNGAAASSQVLLGAVMELVLVGSAVGTAVGLFPFVRKVNESLALGYLFFRVIEAVVIAVGVVAVLALLTLSQDFAAAAAPDPAAYQVAGTVLLAVKAWTFLLGPNLLLGLNTLLYRSLHFRTHLVPRPLAILGMIASALILIQGPQQMFGVFQPLSTPVVLMSLPVAAFEMLLAGWLIVKGFRSAAAGSEPARRPALTPRQELNVTMPLVQLEVPGCYSGTTADERADERGKEQQLVKHRAGMLPRRGSRWPTVSCAPTGAGGSSSVSTEGT
jgi:hypothetical protein